MKYKRILVVSAHAADFVWRAGGTIAKYVQDGAQVDVVVLSLGVRGESNDLWMQPEQTAGSISLIRKDESDKAGKLLGVQNMEFWDLEDYPIAVTPELEDRLVRKIRAVRPQVILTHDKKDILNPDHNLASDFTFRCSIMANSAGVRTEGLEPTSQMRIFGFEPHQTELSDYRPDCFVDITDSYSKKCAAMQCFKSQGHLVEYYSQRAFMRGNHARRLSGSTVCRYAESFSSFFPMVAEELI